jgi:hypothetical protein
MSHSSLRRYDDRAAGETGEVAAGANDGRSATRFIDGYIKRTS